MFAVSGTRSSWVRHISAAPLILTLTIFTTTDSAHAVVPIGNAVAAGAFDAAVRITGSPGGLGTATLFHKSLDPDPENPIGMPERYINLSFITADHVLRPKKPGFMPGWEDDIYNDDFFPAYGGNWEDDLSMIDVNTLVETIGIRGKNPSLVGPPAGFAAGGFDLDVTSGIVRRRVHLGDNLQVDGKIVDIAYVGITVDLTRLPAAKAALLKGLAPLGMAAAPAPMPPDPPADPEDPPVLPQALPVAAPFSVSGGYGISGTPDVNFLGSTFVHHPGVAAEEYGIEREFDNEVLRFVNTAGFYDYIAMQWELDTLNAARDGIGMPGDSGAALTMTGNITGVLTAGRRDLLGGGLIGKSNGYTEIAARLTPNVIAKMNVYASQMHIPEPATSMLTVLGLAVLMVWRGRRVRAAS
jgi:hypothetical protein